MEANSEARGASARAIAEGHISPEDFYALDDAWKTRGLRHDITRTGDRDPIPAHIRSAVWFRDGGRCKLCHDPEPHRGETHLDHIKPWSAGGTDTTDNLRILCARHNIERSNFIDDARPARPATWWCINCYSRDGFGWEYDNGFGVFCPTHRYGPGCRVIHGYHRQFRTHLDTGAPFTNWHEREPISLANATTLAYCAHCDAPGMTDQPL